MKLALIRITYTTKSTIGRLYLDNEFFCYTLEDRVRPKGEKVHGQTAIPAGTYKLVLTKSPKFGKVLPLLEDVPRFTGVRIHGGNTAEDSLGCILVGRQIVNENMIIDSASEFLVNVLQEYGGEHTIEIQDTQEPVK